MTMFDTMTSSYAIPLLEVCRLFFTIYYICSIAFRFGFQTHVAYHSGHWIALFLDYAVDIFFLVDLFWNVRLSRIKRSVKEIFRSAGAMRGLSYRTPLNRVCPEDSQREDTVSAYKTVVKLYEKTQNMADDDNTSIDILSKGNIWRDISSRKGLYFTLDVLMLFPFEVAAFFAGYRYYYYLRAMRLLRIVYLKKYWEKIIMFLEKNNILLGASAHRVLAITLFMIVLAHVAACAFHALALDLMVNRGVTATWMTNDGIAEVGPAGDIRFTKPLYYRYIRSLYWSVVTEQTVGFGDVVPISDTETSFCMFYFYLALVLAILAISNLILLFNVFDSARTKYTEQISNLNKYAQFRSLPTELTDRIKSFYYHQWKILNGLDESRLMVELPHNIVCKIKQATVRDYLKNIKLLRSFRTAILNALAEDIEIFMYSPSDVIVAAGTKARGMYIVSRGEAFVYSSNQNDCVDSASPPQMGSPNASFELEQDRPQSESKIYERSQGNDSKSTHFVISQAMRQGEAYGVQALMQQFVFSSTLSSGACVCEILYLSRSKFRRTCRMYLSDEEFASACTGGLISNKPSQRFLRMSSAVSHMSHMGTGALQVEVRSVWGDMMKPSSSFRNMWDLFVFVALTFYWVTIPILLADTLNPHFFSTYQVCLYWSFLIDFALGVDLFFRCCTFSYLYESVLYVQPRDIFKNFVTRNNVFIEVMRHFPFDILAIGFGAQYLPILRLSKILHFGRLNDYSDRAEKFFSASSGYTLSFTSRRFINLYSALFLLCHWVGCLWQLTADTSTKLFGADINWKIQDSESDFLYMEYDGMYGFSPYRRGIYWAINGMSSAGTADLPSSNLVEMILCCVILICGCQTINALLGSIASLMANYNLDKRRFEEHMATVGRLMKFKRIPTEMEQKIMYSYQYRFSKTSGVNEAEVLAGLPQPLRQAVVKFVAGSVLVKIPFFSNCIEPMLEMILGLLHHRLFLDGDEVVRAGEHGKEMFVIESGNIVVTSPDRKVVYASLVNGDYIGESCLLKVGVRSASAYARDYSDTYILSKESFQKVLDSFPTESEAVVSGIQKVLNEKIKKNRKTILQQGDSGSDSPLDRSSGSSKVRALGSIDFRSMFWSRNMLMFTDFASEKIPFDWCKELEVGSKSRMFWDCMLLAILVYNLTMIPLRLALDIVPSLYFLDYAFDLVLLLDMYLNWTYFRKSIGGRHVVDTAIIRDMYYKTDFWGDVLARFPYELLLIFFIDASTSRLLKIMAILRIPKVFLILKGEILHSQAESILEMVKISFTTMRLAQVLCCCLLVGHWLGCGLYLFSKVHPHDCENEPNAMYGNACEFRHTWVQFLIYMGKLPQDGGSQFSRYIRSVEWAIPTMMLYVVGDMYPMNMNETSYVYGAMFFGITINAMIVGSIISLVTLLDEDRSSIVTQMEILKQHLRVNKVKPETIQKVSNYMKFLITDAGQLILKQNAIFSELPYSLKVATSEHTKMKFFKQCPFFDFCSDEVLKNLCMKLEQEMFFTGDIIISFGDLGQEMYFIDRGSVEVLSNDGATVFAKLQEGGFFGETGLVYRSRRTANIRAATVCVCYVLRKDDFDSELRDCNYSADASELALARLQKGNERRNSAVAANLASISRGASKLSRILGPVVEEPEKTWRKKLAHPRGTAKIVLDICGLLLMFYYAFTIPFEVSFIFGKYVDFYKNFMAVDFTVDTLCIIELIIRVQVFHVHILDDSSSYRAADKLYKSKWDMIWDICGSIPIEIFVLLPSLQFRHIFALRMVHLFRLKNFFNRINQVQKHLINMGLTWQQCTIMVVECLGFYVFVNHWLACLFFLLHRYQSTYRLTWVIADGHATYNEETGEHDVCSVSMWDCYHRAMYFIAVVMSSVGYGDIAPYTDLEMVGMVLLSIVAGCLGANTAGQIISLLENNDKCGTVLFKEKLRSVENYIRYRGLNSDIGAAILTTYHTMWRKERRVDHNKSSFLNSLSAPMAAEVALELNRRAIRTIPVVDHCRPSLRGRIALALKSQMLLPHVEVYSECDTGRCVFFVVSGVVDVTLANDPTVFDEAGKVAKKILERKHSVIYGKHTEGYHFGEMCLMTKTGMRIDNAVACQITEVFSYDQEDIWKLFRVMPFSERYRFLLSLFTETGPHIYIRDVVPSDDVEGQYNGDSIRNLFGIAGLVAEDVLDACEDANEDGRDDELEEPGLRRKRRFMSVISNASDESLTGRANAANIAPTKKFWSNALMAYDRSRLRRRSSDLGLSRHDLTAIRRKSKSWGIPENIAPSVIPSILENTSSKADISVDTHQEAEDLKANFAMQAKEFFLYMDKDKSGAIDKNELMLSLFDLGIEVSWTEVDDIIAKTDMNSDGEIDLEELMSALLSESDSISIVHNDSKSATTSAKSSPHHADATPFSFLEVSGSRSDEGCT